MKTRPQGGTKTALPMLDTHSPELLEARAEGKAAGWDSSRLDAALSKLDGPELALFDREELLMSARSPEVSVLALRDGEGARGTRRLLISSVSSITSWSPSSCDHMAANNE